MNTLTSPYFTLEFPPADARAIADSRQQAVRWLEHQLQVPVEVKPLDGAPGSLMLTPTGGEAAARDYLSALAFGLGRGLGGSARVHDAFELSGSSVETSAPPVPPPPGAYDHAQALMGVDRDFLKRHTADGVVIGHPDTGYTMHPDLHDAPRGGLAFDEGRDLIDGDPRAEDPCAVEGFPYYPGHGTKTASRLCSVTTTAPAGHDAAWRDVVGLAPGAKVVPYRVTKSVILAFPSQQQALARAIDLAVAGDAEVISISLGCLWDFEALELAVARAVAAGVVVCAAAGQVTLGGNVHLRRVITPARLPGVFCAAACDTDGAACGWSFRGERVNVTVPGGNIPVAVAKVGGLYTWDQSYGTSYSAAHLAGAAALWIRHWRRAGVLTPDNRATRPAMLWDALQRSHVDARHPEGGDPGEWGVGILNVPRLLAAEPDPQAASAPEMTRADRAEASAFRDIANTLGLDLEAAQLFAAAVTPAGGAAPLGFAPEAQGPVEVSERIRAEGINPRDVNALRDAGVGAFSRLRG